MFFKSSPPLRNTKWEATSDLIANEFFFPLHHNVPSTLCDQPDALCCGLAHGLCKWSRQQWGTQQKHGVVIDPFLPSAMEAIPADLTAGE